MLDAQFVASISGDMFDVREAERGDDRVQGIEGVSLREKRGGGSIGEHADSIIRAT